MSLQSRIDKNVAEKMDSAANTVSGLSLEEIGLDGHVLANQLWRIAAYLRNRPHTE